MSIVIFFVLHELIMWILIRCPVCRAAIPGWDGKGGGVIGLRPRAVFSL